jgi:streptogramin lyase
MLGNLWRSLVGKPAKLRKPAQGLFGRARLGVEQLEDRCLMTASIAEYPVPSGNSPFGITQGPDGNVWFTEKAGQIGMMNPTTHAITEFAIPTSTGTPTGITAGPDGNIWFTESSANRIGTLNIATDMITEFPITGSDPTAITAGPDGNLWFTETGSNQIGMINPTTKAISQFTVPTGGSSPTGITAGSDGNIWFTENATNKIGVINPITHVFGEYVIPQASSQPNGITSGSDGNIWFAETNTDRIDQINIATHAFTSFLIPGTGEPRSITSASDGNLWFTETGTDQLGTLTLPGDTISMLNIPTAAASPAWISAGPGGTLWFAESATSQVGEVVAPTTVTTAPTNQTIVEGQTATFTASAIGFPTPTVQWQVSTNDGVTYTPITNSGVYSVASATSTTGVTTDTLTVTNPPITMTGYEYEAVFTNGISPSPSVTTAPVTLTVNNVLSIGNPPPQGVINTPYNQTISVIGSTSAFTLFAVNNFLAGGTGLTPGDITTNTVNGTITISGTPTGTGIVSFTVEVANTAGNSLSQNISIVINPPLSIATTTLPQATAGTAYNQSISVIGGAMPYNVFSVTNFNAGTTGMTPGSITANAAVGAFAINVIPAAAGTVTFTVNVTDSAGTVATRNFTLVVNPALAITPSLPQGTAGTNYDETLSVTGGDVPYTSLTVTNFNVGATGLTPANIATNLAAGTITINGTPLAAGTITFMANVTDSSGAVLNQAYTVKINPALTITPSLPQGTAGFSYHQTLTVTGGTTPYTTFTVTGFSAAGTGLTNAAVTVNAAAGTIAVSGTPTGAGTVAFTVNVTDTAGGSLTKAYSITINPPLAVGNLSTTQWTAGSAGFTGTLTIGGGTTPVTIATDSGLPTGMALTLVGNAIGFSGTPSAAGVFSAGSVTLHDAAGATITKTFSITINAAPTIAAPNATQWTTGRSGFNGIMTAAGGTGGLSIAASTGLPNGLSIVLAGNTLSFSGTPSVVGTFAGSVTLSDAIGAKVTRTFSITINAVPSIGNLTTTQWTANKSGFTGTLAITGGTTPHLITAQTGLPPGLTAVVVGTTIEFTGTPTTAGTYSCSVTIQDAAGATVTKTFSITINPPVLIVTASVAPSTMGVLYKATLQATGGTGAITFKVSSGSMPPGYALNSNGTISGLSRGVGSFTFTVTATDAVGASVSKTYTLVIAG